VRGITPPGPLAQHADADGPYSSLGEDSGRPRPLHDFDQKLSTAGTIRVETTG
jgi:hypothetical protein